MRRAKPASVNLALAAIDHFYRYLGCGRPDVRREELAQAAPRALSPEQLQRFMRAVERCESPRGRAIAVLLVNTGLRIGECAALDVDDVAVSARKGRVVVREGKGDAYREVALNAEARDALDVWTARRPDKAALSFTDRRRQCMWGAAATNLQRERRSSKFDRAD